MSTTVTYKGSVITTAENNTKVLETANTWLEDDITLVDVTSGGGGSTLGTKTITQNGTYNATDDNLDGYSEVTVNVSGGVTPTGTKQISITQNGTTTEDVTNYANAEITVNVSGGGGYTLDDLATGTQPSGDLVFGSVNIGAGAFQSKTAITSISGGVLSVGSNGFNGCSNMVSANLSSITGQINNSAFANCTKLEFADLGNCSQINTVAFQNCNKLQTLVLRNSSVCTIQHVNALVNTPIRGYSSGSGTVYVPSSLISSYQTANNWSTIYGEGHCTFTAIEGSQYE